MSAAVVQDKRNNYQVNIPAAPIYNPAPALLGNLPRLRPDLRGVQKEVGKAAGAVSAATKEAPRTLKEGAKVTASCAAAITGGIFGAMAGNAIIPGAGMYLGFTAGTALGAYLASRALNKR